MYAEISKQETERFERAAIVAALRWLCDPLRTMENLQVGDMVKLKSGGPTMTVHLISSNVMCQWFDSAGVLKSGTFLPAQLKKVEPGEPEEPPASWGARGY